MTAPRLGVPLPLVLLLLLAAPRWLAAQAVVLEGEPRDAAAEELQRLLARGEYRVLARDTVLPADFAWPGDLVVFRSVVRLEGRVEGAIAVVHGDLFVRPGAVVAGPILEIDGEAHVSGLATAGEVVTLAPAVQSWSAHEGDRILLTLRAPPPPPRLRPGGLAGLQTLAYDRVNGLSVGVGATARLRREAEGARLAGSVVYHQARRRVGGHAALVLPLGPALEAVATGASVTLTNDAWIRGSLSNSLGALALRSDRRDYFHADLVSLTLARPRGPALIAGESYLRPRLSLLASRDRSLQAADPWSLLDRGDPWRPNPPIADGTLVSVSAGGSAVWRGSASGFLGDASVEWAPEGAGDFPFMQVVGAARMETLAFRGHSLSVYARGMATLGDRAAPPQRWSFVGGGGTLPTLPTAAFRGDWLAFVESVYRAPLPFLPLPVLGSPTLRLYHAAGAAWVTGTPAPAWEQNLGIGLEAAIFHATLLVDPAAPGFRPVLDLGTTLTRPVLRTAF